MVWYDFEGHFIFWIKERGVEECGGNLGVWFDNCKRYGSLRREASSFFLWIVRPIFLWLRICQSAGTCRYVQKRCRAGGFVNGKLGPIVAYNEVVLEYPMGVSSHWMSMIIQYFLCYGVTFECPEWYESKKTSTIISLSLFWLEQWTKRLDSESASLRQHSLFSLARTQACNHRYDNRKTPRHSRPTA